MIAGWLVLLELLNPSSCFGMTEAVPPVSAAQTEVRGTETRRIHAAYKSSLRSFARALIAETRVRHEMKRAGVRAATVWLDTPIAGLDDHDALERERLMAEETLVAETWELAARTERLAGYLAEAVGMHAPTGGRGGAPPAATSRPDLVRSAEAGAFAARQAAQLAEVAADRASAIAAR